MLRFTLPIFDDVNDAIRAITKDRCRSPVVAALMISCSMAPFSGFLAEFSAEVAPDGHFKVQEKLEPLETIPFPLVWMDLQ